MKIIKQTVREVDSFGTKITGPHPDNFLLFFVSLLRMGRMQLWMMVILATVLLAAGLGRFYCGWICPINTLMGLVEGLARKMGWKGRPVPGWAAPGRCAG